MPNSKIAGICVVRDEADIMPILCGHYLRLGFDRLMFVDNNSTDGTFEVLQKLARKFPRISVEKDQESGFRQSVAMSNLANRAIADGYRIVFPFDADEFWNFDASPVRKIAAQNESGFFVGHWSQFVQARSQQFPSKFGLLNVKFRAPGNDDVSYETVESGDQAFIFDKMVKVGVVSSEPVELTRGQHALARGPDNCLANDLEMFHIPLRNAAKVTQRGNRAQRFLETAKPGESWQSRYFQNAVRDGLQDKVWAAHSVDASGNAQLGDRKVALIRDLRFRNTIARAMLYLAGHGYFAW